jgi:hypothetical protein
MVAQSPGVRKDRMSYPLALQLDNRGKYAGTSSFAVSALSCVTILNVYSDHSKCVLSVLWPFMYIYLLSALLTITFITFLYPLRNGACDGVFSFVIVPIHVHVPLYVGLLHTVRVT